MEQHLGHQPPFALRTQVEVFSQFSEAWITGFEIATTFGGRYQLRRLSDDTVLPGSFSGEDLRPRHAFRS